MRYHPRYILTFASPDGFKRRVVILRRSAAVESPFKVEHVRFFAAPIFIRWGAPGGDDLYPALPSSTATIHVVEHILLDAASDGPDAWRVEVQIEIGGAWEIEWMGYVIPDRVRYDPDGRGVVIQADAGFRLWKDLPHLQDGEERVVRTLGRALEALGWDGGLRTLMTWAPWLPETTVPEHVDRAWALATLPEAWRESQHESRVLAVVQALGERFLARLFQSQGRWYWMQRSSLPRPATSGIPTASMWHYTAQTIGANSPPPTTVSIAHNAGGAQAVKLRGVFAETKARARVAESVYDFSPDLDEVVMNGSFEDEGASFGEAEHWEMANGARRDRIADLDTGWDVDVVNTNQHALVVPGRILESDPVAYAEQKDLVFVPASSRYSLKVSYAYGRTIPPGSERTPYGAISVSVGDHFLHMGYVMVSAGAIKGDDVDLYIRPFLSPGSYVGGSYPPGAYPVGTPIIPAGTTLDNKQHAFRLTEDVKIGDTVIHGSLSEDIMPYASGFRAYFWAKEPYIIEWPTALTPQLHPQVGHSYMVDVDGEIVSGSVALRIEDVSPIWDNPAPNHFSVFDGIRVAIQADGRNVGTWGRQASSPSLRYGSEIALPDRRLGDGPSTSTSTRLRVNPAGESFDTLQGDQTGWKEVAYAADEDSTQRTIDALTARIVLQEEVGGLHRIGATLLYRNLRPYAPHQVMSLQMSTAIAWPAHVGASELAVGRRIRPGTQITIGEEIRTVTELAGGEPFVIRVDEALSGSYDEGTRISFREDYWWDRLEWDVRAGKMYFEGTELYRSDTQVVEQIMTTG